MTESSFRSRSRLEGRVARRKEEVYFGGSSIGRREQEDDEVGDQLLGPSFWTSFSTSSSMSFSLNQVIRKSFQVKNIFFFVYCSTMGREFYILELKFPKMTKF